MKRASLSSILLAATVVLATEGCGGNGGGGAGLPPNPFAGRYDGTATLDNNKSAVLDVTVGVDGTVSGTLVVSQIMSPSREGGADEFPVGNYTLSGSSTSAGLVAITGLVPPNKNFAISSTLPQGFGSSQLTITFGSSTFTGAVQQHTTGTGGSITMTQITAGNANLQAFPGTTLLSNVSTSPGKKTLTLTETIDFDSRSFSIDIMDTMQVGQTVTLANSEPRIMFNEFHLGSIFPRVWQSNGGTLTLVSKSGETFSVTLTDVEFIPVPIPGNTATGTFRASGTLHN